MVIAIKPMSGDIQTFVVWREKTVDSAPQTIIESLSFTKLFRFKDDWKQAPAIKKFLKKHKNSKIASTITLIKVWCIITFYINAIQQTL